MGDFVGPRVDPSLLLETPSRAMIQTKKLPDLPSLWLERNRGNFELFDAWTQVAAIKFPHLTPRQHEYLGSAMVGKIIYRDRYDENLEKYLKLMITS